MIYDIHAHFWDKNEISPSLFGENIQDRVSNVNSMMTPERFLEETAAVDRTAVFGLRAKKVGFNIANDTVRAIVNRAPERLVFFTSVDPSEEGYMEELERTHQELGACGIKIGPVYQGVHPLDKLYREIYSYAQKHSLPILTHMATTFVRGVPLDYARPIHIDEVAVDYPDLKVVLAHMGHPWTGEAIAVIRRNPNIYADISALYYRPFQFFEAMRLIYEYKTWDKVFFGSDYPFTTPRESIDGIRNMNHIVENTPSLHIPDDMIERIITADSFGKLGIE